MPEGAADATAALEDDIISVIDDLVHVREMLFDNLNKSEKPTTFACCLSCGYPIRPLTRHAYAGFCDTRAEDWQVVDNSVRRAAKFTVRSVNLRIRDEGGEVLPMELLLATFIHELAHTVTAPEMRRIEEVPEAVLRLQPNTRCSEKGFVNVHHTEQFYANFARLLQTAEGLGIYALPSMPHKFSRKALMRFDYIDPAAQRGGLNLGTSALFGRRSRARPSRIVLTDKGRAKQKLITLGSHTVAELLKLAKQQLNLRKKATLLTDASGTELDDAGLADLPEGALVVAVTP